MTDVSTKDTLMEALGIKFLEYSKERVVATMPVNNKTRQSYGMLHGGASVALAESVAKKTAVGTPVHVGRMTMVWDVRIVDKEVKCR
ncbi:hotdog fold thioesterase [Aliibacillus thermotolerans]|uniref:Hotdog fold thioesterase n=1 Tax=Aliibacillus thermotolerans TaxID=1834418 RepID=A0ABW0U847_9BACI|nr:hotdog fold thioesterase [Aliibacillus thermotolerans]MDA3129334.1 hotdog fold thioesterase [Aliibacillus thermotolerans]